MAQGTCSEMFLEDIDAQVIYASYGTEIQSFPQMGEVARLVALETEKSGCLPQGRSLNFSKPQFSIFKMGIIIINNSEFYEKHMSLATSLMPTYLFRLFAGRRDSLALDIL